ncbi:peroxisome biogenesis factor 2-like [Tigriopus californicus]|uniref:peroxisome biogenesis factor 2-like n=1 Tax=Tigriopus californicus TaxID=6832 RepID=UPI0027DA6648|nr:peroxisome biogenesis factor 2-like [Tigriopus californicus]
MPLDSTSTSLLNLGSELRTILKILIDYWHWNHLKCLHPGQYALNISIDGLTRPKFILYTVLQTIPSYLVDREAQTRNMITPTRGVQKVIHYVESSIQFLRVLNFLKFLQEGLYPNLTTRLLKLKPNVPKSGQAVDGGALSRELFWHTLLELVTILLPLVQGSKLDNWIQAKLAQDKPVQTDSTICSICDQTLIIPSSCSTCSHISCHFCLSTALRSNEVYNCAVCGVVQDKTSLRQIKL